MTAVIPSVNGVGSVSVIVLVIEHPLISVIVTLYVPAVSPD